METQRRVKGWGLALVLIVGTSALAGWADDFNAGSPSPRATQVLTGSETVVIESLEDGLAVDVYRLSCTGPALCAQADVADEGPFNDTKFSVCVTGAKGARGKAQCRVSPRGGLSDPAQVCRSTPGAMTAYVVISEVNEAGAESYSSAQLCTGEGNTSTVEHLLDQ